MSRTAERSCPICGYTEVDVLHTQRFALQNDHPLADGYRVVLCASCGFVYADTPVTQHAYDHFYAQLSKYEDPRTGSGGGHAPHDRRRLENTARTIAEFLQAPTARILDVGCANGGLLQALKDTGYDRLCGIDPSETCVNNTRALGIEAYAGSLSRPLDHGSFDCIVLSHTLEHVYELHQALLHVQGAMRTDPAAALYVEVPDASRYKDFVFAPFQDFNTEHINHFSPASLVNLMHSCGFKVLQEGSKTLESSPGMPYPAIFVFARRSGDGRPPIVKDRQLGEAIQAYITASRAILDAMELNLRHALSTHRNLIVWGTGQLTAKLLVDTSLSSADIVAFVDSNPINQGKILRGVQVVPPEAVHSMPEPILIASTLHQNEIASQIRGMGLPNTLIFLGGPSREQSADDGSH